MTFDCGRMSGAQGAVRCCTAVVYIDLALCVWVKCYPRCQVVEHCEHAFVLVFACDNMHL